MPVCLCQSLDHHRLMSCVFLLGQHPHPRTRVCVLSGLGRNHLLLSHHHHHHHQLHQSPIHYHCLVTLFHHHLHLFAQLLHHLH